nr:PREDICTED: phospholipase A2-like isoform X2 [Tribolium castaneum]|eukprot:XP_015836099.1 PREDICTED: phospholipase A2-like isoform X2 [Tribolium castaneum]
MLFFFLVLTIFAVKCFITLSSGVFLISTVALFAQNFLKGKSNPSSVFRLETSQEKISTIVRNSLNHRRLLSIREKFIVPGTKWCGVGDIATSYQDLGRFKEADTCCREHDSCLEYISMRDSFHGITNKNLFTVSHCDCDEKFRKCLKSDGNLFSEIVGYGYFTLVGPQCFREDYPIVRCKEHVYIQPTSKKRATKRCLDYELNESLPKEYQLFDNRPF